jgi:DNA-nicking Smr family endonuclease
VTRRLTAEEEALWRRVTDDVARSARPRAIARVQSEPKTGDAPARRAPSIGAMFAGDPRQDRHVARRRREIDAVLDLHGLTEAAAHARFRLFVADALRSGARIALVITGKGRGGGDGAGVLRRRFLGWIDEPAMRAHLARVAPAHPRDGGEGAFYLFLKAPG